MKKSLIVLTFISLFLLGSCGEAEDKPLSRTFKRQIDSLARVYNKAHEAEYDSICQLRMDSLTMKYYDSILEKKLIELEKLNR